MSDYGIDWVKRYKEEHGAKRIEDVLALSRDHDPFFIGTDAHREMADWFAKAWEQHYQGQTEIHLRRVHYRLDAVQFKKPDGTSYQNVKADWNYLQLAALYARILHPDRVPADCFDDRRNPSPHVMQWIGDPSATSEPFVLAPSHDLWRLPSVRVDLPSLDLSIDPPRIFGYDADDYLDRAYCLELWIEKSTMDDILAPLCDQLGVRLVTAVGFQSLTSTVKLLARVAEIKKPTRIFYISDYDNAGRKMPVAVARHIEYWRKRYAPDSDIKLKVLGLTKAQITKYHLPKFIGTGATELDALEATAPGELARTMREAIEPYLDDSIGEQLDDAKNEATEIVEDEWSHVMRPHLKKARALQKRVNAVTAKYQRQADELNKRLMRDLAPFQKPLAALRADVEDEANNFAPELPSRPKQEMSEADEADWLFDSARSYGEQLAFYIAHKSQ